MKRTYEAMILLDNREVKQGWQALKDTVTGFFTKHGADIKSARRWDERRLAYPIARQLRGTYLLIYFEAETSGLGMIRRELEYAEPVLRHLTHVCEEIPADAFDPEEAFDEDSVRIESQGDPVTAEAAGDDPEEGDDESSKDDEKSEDDDKSGDDDSEGDSDGDSDADAEGDSDDSDDEKKED